MMNRRAFLALVPAAIVAAAVVKPVAPPRVVFAQRKLVARIRITEEVILAGRRGGKTAAAHRSMMAMAREFQK